MGDKDQIIRIGVTGLGRLATAFNLQNIKIIQGSGKNPYEGKIHANPETDLPLYYSTLGTPIFADITLGDPTNENKNSYTDPGGFPRRFNAMTFATVLLTILQTKNIVTTDIQGRDGSIKEYIGLGDYQVTINGIIPGSNGHYPDQEVNQLYQILRAPIAIDATSWWLQIFNIQFLVIKDFTIPQLPGEYSQQSFSINAVSDFQQEIKFIPGA